MTRRKRSPRRLTVNFDKLIAEDADLAKHDALWTRLGYRRAGGKLFGRRDGTCTLRLVWRRTVGNVKTSVSYTMQGLSLS
ncbi:hypothetical protein [Blastochloris tepida]|uniref:Uncharacterized protein n=1 Tax=Blastochloris tepida TaxID=2233851 RepID=A0A348FYJ6_9HYPH|nr:hypothetical protein [Blastochloris tepida]BBF92379.1 hypothetical protein BLTE_10640 [Blastochloris tepida]